jgi:hypothetical protein
VAGIAVNSPRPISLWRFCTGDVAFVCGAVDVEIGKIYVLVCHTGGICPTDDLASPMNAQVIGVGLSSTEIYFKIINSNAPSQVGG